MDKLVFVSGGFSLHNNILRAKLYMPRFCVANAHTSCNAELKIKEELLNMFFWKDRENVKIKKKKSLEDQTRACLSLSARAEETDH